MPDKIVGKSKGRAFLWQNGVMTDLNTWLPTNSGWFLTEARALNAAGQIVGAGTTNGQTRAFRLSPVPDVPPFIDSASRLSDGQFRFRLLGTSGKTYLVQVSTNLIHWVNLNTNTLTGSFTNYQDAQATNFPPPLLSRGSDPVARTHRDGASFNSLSNLG